MRKSCDMENLSVDISVIIPTYNSMNTIERAVVSVCNQTVLPKEIIIIDDCSTAIEMRSTLENVRDRFNQIIPIKIVYSNKNGGPGTARNLGLDDATGKYIAFLDSDDVWHPEKLELQYNIMEQDQELYFLTSEMDVFSEDTVKKFCVEKAERCEISRLNPYKSLFKHARRACTSGVMIRNNKEFRFESGKRYAEDYLLWLKICFKYKGAVLYSTLVAFFKQPYGEGGLTGNIWKLEKGELETFKILREEGYINFALYYIVCVFSMLKCMRRIIICKIRQ